MYQSSYKSRNQLINTYRNARLCIYVFICLCLRLCFCGFMEMCYNGNRLDITINTQAIILFLYLIIIPLTIPGILYHYAHPLLVMIEAAGDGRNLITLQLYARYQYISIRLIAALSAH